ncbi:FecR family protein [Chitinophaga solisilvae]|uniref:FecR family protein n=1 Tax=Chitinophaga solisilvae TaxID=1233460 RepID=UPI00136AE599|nr:FecR domain-containing protein [Chitinophaga solisilvae]
MDHNDTSLYDLIAKQLSSVTTAEENTVIEQWLEQSAENRDTYAKLQLIWQDSVHAVKPQKQYNTAAAWEKVSHSVQAPVPLRARFSGFKYAAAAAILVLLSAGAWWLASRPTLKVQELAANEGKIKSLELSDKSVITLRPGARIKYTEGARRLVELEGEAYFEVASDPAHPFVVKTPNLSFVEVLGTAFTVKTASAHTTVIVASGKVKLGAENDTSAVILSSGQKGVWGNGQMSAISNDNPNFMAWKTGILQFNDQSLVEILPQLADFYGKDIRIDESYRATATQQKATISFHDQSCDEVLHELQLLLGFNYKEEDGIIVIGR